MEKHAIDVMCIQETHKPNSAYFVTGAGYLLILSGTADVEKESAGVGFIMSPSMRRSIIGFCQLSERLASVKLRVTGGKAVLFSAYAPHSGKPFGERQTFYQHVAEAYSATSSHGPKLLFGDWNARLYRRMPGEEKVIGEHVFYNSSAAIPADANRNLLLELCASNDLVIANTFSEHQPDALVTCYNVGHHPMDQISWKSHSQIDFLLCPREWHVVCKDIRSYRSLALASHHFAIISSLDISVSKPCAQSKRPHACVGALADPLTANRFAVLFEDFMGDTVVVPDEQDPDPNRLYAALCDAFQAAASATLPSRSARPMRPWISERTLRLLDARSLARQTGDWLKEQELNRDIRLTVKGDRARWLDALVATGDWSQVRKLRKGHTPSQGRLRNANGAYVSSEQRAETLAQHLESVQWSVRPTTVVPEREHIHSPLLADIGRITEREVLKAAKTLKRNRARGMDDIPAEYWKAVLVENSESARWVVDFCNACWQQRAAPDIWHKARVATIFKSGDPADCNNDRPISLLTIGYKLFAQVLLNRLKEAGAEDRIWKTQFGFRRGRGTSDALLLARLTLEKAWGGKNGGVAMLALDWAKAFDSVSPAALANAMKRFGVPPVFIEMVLGIYSQRQFLVRDGGFTSDWHAQAFGISQGCP